MNELKRHLLIVILLSVSFAGKAQSKIDPKTIKDKMQWFADAKLGIFIHAGIYSVDGIDESWSFHNRKINHSDYMKQLKGFHHDNNWKTPYEIITIFADAVSNGGNLLLDMGPKEDGTIPDEQIHVLKELGSWNKKNGEAIFNTVAGPPQGHFYGPTTLSKDSTTLYLFLHGKTSGRVMLKGLINKIEDISVVGNGARLTHKVVGKISWSPVPGLVYIDVPENILDPYVTVLKLKLTNPIQLYRGHGGLN
jgi:hypothetical protein